MFSHGFSKSLLPLVRGEKVAGGRMRGLFAGSDTIKYLTALPLTPPSPLRRGEGDAVNYFSNGPYHESELS